MPQLEGEQQDSEVAAHCADIMAILNDIAQSNDAARIFLSGRFNGEGDNMRIRRSLYESAFISFRRALKNGASRIPGNGRGTWKIPASDLAMIIGSRQDVYQQINEVADRCVAHRASPEAGLAEVVKNAPEGKPFVQIKYTERNSLALQLLDITEDLKKYLMPLMAEKCKSAVSPNEA